MKAEIFPGTAYGTIFAPPSKSDAHRALISAALSSGNSSLCRVEYSNDILATIDCLTALGAKIESSESGENGYKNLTVTGIPEINIKKDRFSSYDFPILNCRESGSTLRFLIPLCLISGESFVFGGSRRLMERPLEIYKIICAENGFVFDYVSGNCINSVSQSDNFRFLKVSGRLKGGKFMIPGNISSQFVSGLLFALPLLQNDSEIILLPPVESRSYISMTLDSMKKAGIYTEMNDNRIFVPRCQSYKAFNSVIEGDYSNAAFFDAFNYIGGNVSVSGLSPASSQGDRVYNDLFNRIANINNDVPVISISDCPDLAPILFVMAAIHHGAIFEDTFRLKLKESDRGVAMATELAKFGIDTDIGENNIVVRKSKIHAPTSTLCSHNDHRIVMSLSVLSSLTGGIIDGAEAVRKSIPGFFDLCKTLGIKINLYDDQGD